MYTIAKSIYKLWGSFEARKQFNNRHKSDLIHYQTGMDLGTLVVPFDLNIPPEIFERYNQADQLKRRILKVREGVHWSGDLQIDDGRSKP